ncbi:MAG: hypothetical protein HYS23_10840 [Geobacter sp.]|nr:hypothetical protein [Geobacter sp.]
MGRIKIALVGFFAVLLVTAFTCGSALAIGIKVVPSSQRVLPGEEFFFDVVAEGIPAEGLGGVQFRLNVVVPGGSVTGVNDLPQAGAGEVAVASPLLVSLPTATRSGIGDFFWNGRGGNGILVMDNEPLVNGSGLYTFAHTNGSTPPSGSGSVARFMVRVGSGVNSKQIDINLSDVMLLDGGPFYPLDYNNGATVQIGCFTRMPDLTGLSLAEATARLAQSQLVLGSTYEIDNPGGTRSLNVVLEQSALAGSELLCEAAVNLAVNNPPNEVTGGLASDKPGDDSGAVLLTWTPSASSDTAGYRVYLGSSLLIDIPNPVANGTEIGGLATGVPSQLKVTVYDSHGNESQGTTIAATPLDDVAPVVTIGGVTEGAYYRNDVTPQVTASDTNLAETAITLNGNPYSPAPITADGAYTLTATGVDRFGNQATQTVHFTMDKTPPVITIAGVADGGAYNTDITPVISVADTNLKGSSVLLNGQPYVLGSPVMPEGSYSLSVGAEDLAGNSASQTVTFIIDKTSPVSSAIAVSPKYANGGVLFVSGQTPVTASAQDTGVAPSGVAGMEYRLDDAQGWSAYGAPVAFAGLPDGVHALNYRAFDRATNVETFQTFTATVDNTPPTSVLTVGDPKFTSPAGENFATRDSLFTVTATDSLSGVAATQLKLGSGSWDAFASFTLAGEGAHTFQYRSQDNLTNEETAKAYTVTIDNTPPVTGISAGAPQYTAQDGTLYVSGATPVTLTATDNASGVARTEFKVDGGAWMSYAPFTVAAEGEHVIAYRSIDNVGNIEPEKSITITVDNTPPVSAITTGTPQHEAGGKLYVTGATNFTISASDNLSDVVKSEYRIDGGTWISYAPFTISGEGAHAIEFRSQDNVGNLEEAKSLAVVVDNTPPVTAITPGTPRYEAVGKLHVTSGTSFTLSATDNLSGTATTEYRIDNGPWTPYASFVISGEGSHAIGYRSIDNLGNLEVEKVLIITVDNTPPESAITVGSPQHFANGDLYISGGTYLAISATDSASGVKTSEYSLDEGAFAGYGAPFNLAVLSDGSHTINYRSTDNVGNVEIDKKLTVVLDKTPPQTTITASDPLVQGVVNTVSPVTGFILSAADELSGVKTVWYRIDGGQWQLYTGSFTLAGMTTGAHTISFNAEDNVGNAEQEQTITVRLIVMEIAKEVSLDPVVLVGAWTDSLNTVRNQGAIDSLSAILSSLGVNYTVAGNGDAFKRSLRSGRYNTYILVDYRDEKVGDEIREAVNYGDSLIFIKSLPSADPALDEAFGVKFTGRTTSDNLMVTLKESPVSGGATIQSSGKSVVGNIVANTAYLFGYVNDKRGQYPSVVFNEYGSGKVLLYTFDLLNSADRDKVEDLIANSINLLKQEQHRVHALDSVPVSITIANSAEPLGLRVTETIPSETTADTVMPAGALAGNTITWEQYLAALERAKFGYYLNLPDAKGNYTATSEVRYANYGNYLLYGTANITLSVIDDLSGLLQKIISELNGISTSNSNDLVILTDAFGLLSQVNVNPPDARTAEKNVETVTKVAWLIRGLSVDSTEIRLNLDELLKVLEKKWYLMGGQD